MWSLITCYVDSKRRPRNDFSLKLEAACVSYCWKRNIVCILIDSFQLGSRQKLSHSTVYLFIYLFKFEVVYRIRLCSVVKKNKPGKRYAVETVSVLCFSICWDHKAASCPCACVNQHCVSLTSQVACHLLRHYCYYPAANRAFYSSVNGSRHAATTAAQFTLVSPFPAGGVEEKSRRAERQWWVEEKRRVGCWMSDCLEG